jgi:hypothetical protein
VAFGIHNSKDSFQMVEKCINCDMASSLLSPGKEHDFMCDCRVGYSNSGQEAVMGACTRCIHDNQVLSCEHTGSLSHAALLSFLCMANRNRTTPYKCQLYVKGKGREAGPETTH